MIVSPESRPMADRVNFSRRGGTVGHNGVWRCQFVNSNDSGSERPSGRPATGADGHRPFGELTKDWPASRRRRVRKTRQKHERAIAGADPGGLSKLAVVDLGLTEADARAVADALANPSKPTARLKKAARRHSKLVASNPEHGSDTDQT